MNNKLKTLLKTTSAIATLLVGSQSWGAALQDTAGADQAAADITVASNDFDIYTALGAVTVPYTGAGNGVTVNSGGTLAFVLAPAVTTAMTFDDPLILNSDSSLYLLAGSPGAFNFSSAIVSSAINASASGVKIYLTGPTTLPDMSAMRGTTLKILNSLTLTGAGAATGFGGPIEIPEGKTLTQASWGSCGPLFGKGAFTAAAVATTVNGDISGDLTLTLTNATGLTVNGNVSTESKAITIPASVLNAAISGKVTIPVSFTTSAPTSILGGLAGSGSLIVSGATGYLTVAGDVSGFTGSVTLNANPAMFTNAPNVNFTGHQAALTFSKGGIVKKITNSAASVLSGGPDGDLTVATYDMASASATFNPGAGKKVTIGTLVQSSAATQTITVGAGGTMAFNSNVDMGAVTNSFASPTTLKKLTMVGAGTVNATANMTIDELDVSSAAVTFIPAAGVTVTVKKVTGNNNITVNGAGTLSIKLPADYSGDVATTLGKLKTN